MQARQLAIAMNEEIYNVTMQAQGNERVITIAKDGQTIGTKTYPLKTDAGLGVVRYLIRLFTRQSKLESASKCSCHSH